MKLKLVGTGAIIGKERSACSLVDEKILIDRLQSKELI